MQINKIKWNFFIVLISLLSINRAKANPFPLAITISGGVSLGAYEAGYMYYSSEMFKNNPKVFDIKMITGASAGSINAFLTLFSLCSEPWLSPQESPFWKMWMPIGFEQLDIRDPEKSKFALFSKKELVKVSDSLETRWNEGLKRSCDVVLGLAATRANPKLQKIRDDLAVTRVEEKFLLRVKGKGKNIPPQITNYPLPESSLPQSLLYFEKNSKTYFKTVRDLIFGTASVPLIFDAEPVKFCYEENNKNTCDQSNVQKDYFSDGGFFDNSPLRLAYRAVESGLKFSKDGKAHWQDEAQLGSLKLKDKVYFSHLDLDSYAYPYQVLDDEKNDEKTSLIQFVSKTMSQYITHARSKDIYTLLEESYEMKGQLRVTTNYFPRMSDHMNAFFGFIERDFREFDFLLGIYDAYRYFNYYVPQKLEKYNLQTKVPHHLKYESVDFGNKGPWAKKLRCLISYFDESPDFRKNCEGVDKNFLILAQISMNRLFSFCEKKPDSPKSIFYDHKTCLKAGQGYEPVQLIEGFPTPWRQMSKEGNIKHTFRLLEAYRFEFRDLGLKPEQSHLGLEVLKEKLEKSLLKFAAVQNTSDKALIYLSSQPVLQVLGYTPPQSIWYVTVGGRTEVGNSYRLFPKLVAQPRLRLNSAIQFQGLLAKYYAPFAITASIGPEYEFLGLNSAIFQFRLALRGGYLLSQNDHYGADGCNIHGKNRYSGECSMPVAQLQGSIGILDRLRLSGALESPLREKDDPMRLWNFYLGIGAQWN